MPTYEYRCKRGHLFEREQPINDEPITVCDQLDSEAPCGMSCQRLISSTSFVLKGSCWAKDRYTKK